MADLENFGGGDFKHKTSKIRMSSPKLRLIFRPKSGIQTFFSPKIRWSSKKKKVLTEIESDFSAEIVRFRLVGGGCIPPIPPLNPPLQRVVNLLSLLLLVYPDYFLSISLPFIILLECKLESLVVNCRN